MKSVRITHAVRLFAFISCVFLLPSCKLVSSVVKLPVNVVKSTARMVGVSNLTDHPAQPVSKEMDTKVEPKVIDSRKERRSLD
ncbi:MAG: hypothetical protein ACPIA7_02920 [Akkermansiaceae bacterium]